MINCPDCDIEFTSNRSLSNHLRGGCKTNRKYEKICDCGKILKYRSPKEFKKSIDNNSKCISCCEKIKNHSNETKERISNKLKLLYKSGEILPNMTGAHSLESREKMSNTKKGGKLSNETKNKIRESVLNSELHKKSVKDPNRNRSISEKNTGRIVSVETRIKMSKSHADISGDKNPSKKPEVRRKLRLKRIERINSDLERFGKSILPNFNIKGCEFFDKIMIENKCYIRHALNDGEYFIEDLGYWLDGYDEENNIVYEWDERHHYDVYGNLLEKDINRQREIEDYLKCKFIRIRQED